MTRQEVLKDYDIVATRFPKKGELIMTVTNHGGVYGVQKIDKDWKMVVCDILKKKG